MTPPIVISLCDYSTTTVKPWSDAGYECYAVDMQHAAGQTRDGNIIRVGANILDCVSQWLPAGRKIIFAAAYPACTHTAVSGARHFRRKGPAAAAESFQLIARCQQLLKWFEAPYFWEQPVSTTSTYCGPPDYIFDPYQYAGYLDNPNANAYTKKTCLWTGGGFQMPPTKPVEPVKVCQQGSWIQQLGGSSTRTKNLRSQTPEGFARAVFEANH